MATGITRKGQKTIMQFNGYLITEKRENVVEPMADGTCLKKNVYSRKIDDVYFKSVSTDHDGKSLTKTVSNVVRGQLPNFEQRWKTLWNEAKNDLYGHNQLFSLNINKVLDEEGDKRRHRHRDKAEFPHYPHSDHPPESSGKEDVKFYATDENRHFSSDSKSSPKNESTTPIKKKASEYEIHTATEEDDNNKSFDDSIFAPMLFSKVSDKEVTSPSVFSYENSPLRKYSGASNMFEDDYDNYGNELYDYYDDEDDYYDFHSHKPNIPDIKEIESPNKSIVYRIKRSSSSDKGHSSCSTCEPKIIYEYIVPPSTQIKQEKRSSSVSTISNVKEGIRSRSCCGSAISSSSSTSSGSSSRNIVIGAGTECPKTLKLIRKPSKKSIRQETIKMKYEKAPAPPPPNSTQSTAETPLTSEKQKKKSSKIVYHFEAEPVYDEVAY